MCMDPGQIFPENCKRSPLRSIYTPPNSGCPTFIVEIACLLGPKESTSFANDRCLCNTMFKYVFKKWVRGSFSAAKAVGWDPVRDVGS